MNFKITGLYKKPKKTQLKNFYLALLEYGASVKKVPSDWLEAFAELKKLLKNLKDSLFVRAYNTFGYDEKNIVYQLTDYFTLFYLRFMKGRQNPDEHFWTHFLDNPGKSSWAGQTFEQVCKDHIMQVKKAIGISALLTDISSWHGATEGGKAQIDLIIDRREPSYSLPIHIFGIVVARQSYQAGTDVEHHVNHISQAVMVGLHVVPVYPFEFWQSQFQFLLIAALDAQYFRHAADCSQSVAAVGFCLWGCLDGFLQIGYCSLQFVFFDVGQPSIEVGSNFRQFARLLQAVTDLGSTLRTRVGNESVIRSSKMVALF